MKTVLVMVVTVTLMVLGTWAFAVLLMSLESQV
jgi:hypothetical protein